MGMAFARQPEPIIDLDVALDRWSMDIELRRSGTGEVVCQQEIKLARINNGQGLLTKDDLGFELPQAEKAHDLFSNPAEVWLIEAEPLSCRRNDRHLALRYNSPLVRNFPYLDGKVDVYVKSIRE